MAKLTEAQAEALLELTRTSTWVIWTEGRESHITDVVLRSLFDIGFAAFECVNATTHAYRITDLGRQALSSNGRGE